MAWFVRVLLAAAFIALSAEDIYGRDMARDAAIGLSVFVVAAWTFMAWCNWLVRKGDDR